MNIETCVKHVRLNSIIKVPHIMFVGYLELKPYSLLEYLRSVVHKQGNLLSLSTIIVRLIDSYESFHGLGDIPSNW